MPSGQHILLAEARRTTQFWDPLYGIRRCTGWRRRCLQKEYLKIWWIRFLQASTNCCWHSSKLSLTEWKRPTHGRQKDFFQGGTIWDFSKIFPGEGAKSGEICFLPLEIKATFFAEIFKIQRRAKAPPSDANGPKTSASKRDLRISSGWDMNRRHIFVTKTHLQTNFFHCAKPDKFICIVATNATGTLPGPFAPPLDSLPRRKITARSYSCTT